MKIDEIKNTVEKLGYLTMADKNGLIVGIDNGKDPDFGWKLLRSTFVVTVKNNRINIEYSVGQIPVNKEFKTNDEFTDFILEVFPIS